MARSRKLITGKPGNKTQRKVKAKKIGGSRKQISYSKQKFTGKENDSTLRTHKNKTVIDAGSKVPARDARADNKTRTKRTAWVNTKTKRIGYSKTKGGAKSGGFPGGIDPKTKKQRRASTVTRARSIGFSKKGKLVSRKQQKQSLKPTVKYVGKDKNVKATSYPTKSANKGTTVSVKGINRTMRSTHYTVNSYKAGGAAVGLAAAGGAAYYWKNKRNAKTGTRSEKPSEVRSLGRVRRKGY